MNRAPKRIWVLWSPGFHIVNMSAYPTRKRAENVQKHWPDDTVCEYVLAPRRQRSRRKK